MEELTGPEKMTISMALHYFNEGIKNGTIDPGTGNMINPSAWAQWSKDASNKLDLPELFNDGN